LRRYIILTQETAKIMDTTSRGHSAAGRSLAGLFADLWRETFTLVRDEEELAKTELSERVTRVETGVAGLAIGGAIAFAGLLVLLDAAVNALHQVLPPDYAGWLAPSIIGAAVLLVGLVVLVKARRELRTGNFKPARTLRSLRSDAELAREHLR
jgi:hypothetical protein